MVHMSVDRGSVRHIASNVIPIFRISSLKPMLVAVLALLPACSSNLEHSTSAQSTAAAVGMVQREIPAGGFDLTAYVRIKEPGQPITVYIEGDGAAWRSRTEPSSDPTPQRFMGLRLAELDPSANVAYLARPCQYSRGAACNTTYWTDRRFSEEVIAAMSAALDRLKTAGGIHLVGYSGGAAVAVLVAARRNDILSLRTVAGNLDSEAVNRFNRVSPMPASLNPVDVAARLTGLPQRHLTGSADRRVPPFIAEGFVAALGPSRCATVTVVPGASHESGWEKVWPTALPTCDN